MDDPAKEERESALALLRWVDETLLEFDQFEELMHEPDYPDSEEVRKLAKKLLAQRSKLLRMRKDAIAMVAEAGAES